MTPIRSLLFRKTLPLAAGLVVAACLLAGLATTARPASAAGDCGGAPTQEDIDQSAQLFDRINAYRGQNGVAALTPDGALTRAAGWMARDMVGRGDGVGHVDSLGRNTNPRLPDCGYTGFASVSYKENVCCTVRGSGSVKTPEQAFEAWRTSTNGHNEAMLDGGMRFAGVGRSCNVQTCYWVLDLGSQRTNVPLPGAGGSAGSQGGTATFESVNFPGRFIRHRNALGELTPVASGLDHADATWVVRPALSGTPGAVSFESSNHPGTFLRHQSFRVKQHRNDNSDLFKKDASFIVRPGLAGGDAQSFEAVNVPGFFIRHANWELWIARNDGSDLFEQDASFRRGAPSALRLVLPADGASFESTNVPGHYIRHRNWLADLTQIAGDLDRADATFYVGPALSGTPGAVSFESSNYPGTFLRHEGFRLKLEANDGSDLFEKDASFIKRAALNGAAGAVSFEAVNVPGHFLRHTNFEFWLAKNDGSALFRDDASFRQRGPR